MDSEQKSLAELLALDTLTTEGAAEVSADVATAVFAAVSVRSVGELSEKDVSKLSSLIDANASTEEVYEFLCSHLKNFEHIVSEEAAKILVAARKLQG